MLELVTGTLPILEWVNSGVCLALLCCLLPVATVASKWQHRTSNILMALALGIQVADPFARWIPTVAWTQVLLNAAILAVVIVWRHEIWAVVRHRLRIEPRQFHRRATDMLGQP
jgi:hypothetical protein